MKGLTRLLFVSLLFCVQCATLVPTSRSVKADKELTIAQIELRQAEKKWAKAVKSGKNDLIRNAGLNNLRLAARNVNRIEKTSVLVRESEGDLQSVSKWRSATWGLGVCCLVLLAFVFLSRRR